MSKNKAVFCWSGGKDSAYCLNKVINENLYEVKYLLTTVSDPYKRISMHGVREELLDMQAAAIGIPLIKIRLSEATNHDYEKQMETTLLKAKSEGIEYVIFGDIFLEDLRQYRETNLAKINMKAMFPLWKQNTSELLRNFVEEGFKTVVCCTNDGFLGEEWAGKEIDAEFADRLPANVDPCGENGEYHTFCYDGPLFRKKIEFETGEKIYRPLQIQTDDNCTLPANKITQGFWYCDLLPVNG